MKNNKITILASRPLVRYGLTLRVILLFGFHAVVFAACYLMAWLIRFDFHAIRPQWLETFKNAFVVVVGMQLLAGTAFNFYRGWWRYVGLADVIRLVAGLTSALAILLAAWYAGPFLGIPSHFVKLPRGVLLADWAFSVLTLFGARVAIRLGRDQFRPAEPKPASPRRVLVIGAGDAGETLVREIQHRPQLGIYVAGFVDDQRPKWGSHIRGIDVYGPISEIRDIAERLKAEEALIAIPSASGKRIREIIHHLSAANLEFKTMPGIDQLVSGKVNVTQLRPVNVEDLLRRKRIDLPGDPVRAMFTGERVLVTGAGGTIGSELSRQIMQLEPESVILVERSEYALYELRKRLSAEQGRTKTRMSWNLLDICDHQLVEAALARERPRIVVHAAAHKHVPIGEENPLEYLRNNCLATWHLAEMCAKAGVERLVLISTDKAINPSSVMGATKRAAEIALIDVARRTNLRGTAVRFGNVIGSSGSVVPLFMEQIMAGGPITVTHPDVTRYFIRTSEAISLVLQAATLGNAGDVFTLDMGEPVKIVDLARDLLRLSNHTEEDVPITFSGLRPGEKLFEEIRLKGESVRPTVHPQIVVTETPQPRSIDVQRWLALATEARTAEESIAALRALIPEYGPPATDDDGTRSRKPLREAAALTYQPALRIPEASA